MFGVVKAKPYGTIQNLTNAAALNWIPEGAMMPLRIRQFFGTPEELYGVTPPLISELQEYRQTSFGFSDGKLGFRAPDLKLQASYKK